MKAAKLICLTLLLVGCSSKTRLPSWEPSHPVAERQSAELFYPYAEETAGPQTFTQPRDYDRQRAEPTRLQRSRFPVLGPTIYEAP